MKREILCPECGEMMRKIGERVEREHPGEEKVVLIEGLATGNFICDSCGKRINFGDCCCASSIYLTSRNDYYPWEPEYILAKENQDRA